jgi:hypothetical protein
MNQWSCRIFGTGAWHAKGLTRRSNGIFAAIAREQDVLPRKTSNAEFRMSNVE